MQSNLVDAIPNDNDQSQVLSFSHDEVIFLYTALSALPNLPPEYWYLKEKIEKYVNNKLSLQDIIKIKKQADCVFLNSDTE